MRGGKTGHGGRKGTPGSPAMSAGIMHVRSFIYSLTHSLDVYGTLYPGLMFQYSFGCLYSVMDKPGM